MNRFLTATLSLGMLLSFAGSLHAATPQVPKEYLVGANVDAGQLMPDSPRRIVTTQGDLFDLAKAVGINAFRVTVVSTWNIDEPDVPYTPSEWKSLGERAKATGIYLVPIVELPRADRDGLDSGATQARSDKYYKAACVIIDSILGPTGLGRLDVVAAIDLANEPALYPSTITTLQRLSDYVHSKYPGVPVTVGGSKADVANKNAPGPAFGKLKNAAWIWNAAHQLNQLVAMEDVVSPHIYGLSPSGSGPLGGHTASVITDAVFQRIMSDAQDAGGKPIYIQEFGVPNGLSSVRSQMIANSDASPEIQAQFMQAFLAGVRKAKDAGANVRGTFMWMLAPRGSGFDSRAEAEPNSFSVIVPQGPGQPVKLLPALFELCPDQLSSCPSTLNGLKTATVLSK